MKTVKDVLTAMECCMENSCDTCPYKAPEFCGTEIFTDAYDALAKLVEENRALRTELAVNGKDDVPVKNVGNIPDQTAKQDYGKLDPTLVPVKVIWAIAAVRRFGLTKYHDPFNYRQVEKERLRAAAYRHLLKYVEDPERIDPESGLPHLWHLATNVAFLCELEGGTHD